MSEFVQKIFFGPPGCGKSFHVRLEAADMGVNKDSPNMIETAFHPEYGYGDFVAKLLPKNKKDGSGSIEYHIHAGPLLKALARAYAGEKHVLLVIDEINRGNCAQIFGDIFQLLDRDDTGWSEYGIDPSDLIKDALKQELEFLKNKPEDLSKKLEVVEGKICKLRLPPNLSLIGTMNTSDESVYYMDTAFKRRWDFKFMSWQGESVPQRQRDAKIKIGAIEHTWHDFLERLNNFIAHEFKGRCVDDKQVGLWFLKAKSTVLPENLTSLLKILEELRGRSDLETWKNNFPNAMPYTNEKDEKRLDCESIKSDLKKKHKFDFDDFNFRRAPSDLARELIDHINHPFKDIPLLIAFSAIQNKLMFFLWDNVFSRNRVSLCVLLGKEVKTFGDFASEENATTFINKVMDWTPPTKST